jgi:signal transduction histidine kinase
MVMGHSRLAATPDLVGDSERLRVALAESEARFRDVIERNADAIVVVDREGAVRFANAMAERLFGLSREELIGTRFGFPAIAGETTELDLLARGSLRVAEMRVVESRWEGEVAYLASLRDVTARKEAERNARTLLAAEEVAVRQRFLLDLSSRLSQSLDYERIVGGVARECTPTVADQVLVICFGTDGSARHIEIAPEPVAAQPAAQELRALLEDPDEPHSLIDLLKFATPRILFQLDEPTDLPLARHPRAFALLRQLGVTSAMLVPMRARGNALGSIVFAAADDRRVFSPNDLALATDVAARAALAIDNATLYRDAQRANEARTTLLAVVSHDLRTPLNAIVGYADLLAEGIPEPLPDRSLHHVERIRRSARHLLYLMNEFLTFTRLDAGGEEVHDRDGVDVREIVDDVAAVMEPVSAKRGLRFRVDSPAEPVRLRTDPDKLRQVMLNIAGNAVKYTTQGEVGLRLAAQGDHVVLEVRDTGIGITEADLPRIFEPFWQVDATQRSHDGGSGLGLSIVRRILHLLGGRIAVASTPGAGTTVTVTLLRSKR